MRFCLFPRVMVPSPLGPAVFPVVEIPRDHEGVLPLISLSTSPVHRGFPWGIDEPASEIFGRDVCVIEEEGFLGDVAIQTRGMYYELFFRRLCVVKRKWFRAHELRFHGGRRFGASGDGSNRGPSMLSRTRAGNLELIEELGYRGRSEDELHARVLPFLYYNIDRRF